MVQSTKPWFPVDVPSNQPNELWHITDVWSIWWTLIYNHIYIYTYTYMYIIWEHIWFFTMDFPHSLPDPGSRSKVQGRSPAWHFDGQTRALDHEKVSWEWDFLWEDCWIYMKHTINMGDMNREHPGNFLGISLEYDLSCLILWHSPESYCFRFRKRTTWSQSLRWTTTAQRLPVAVNMLPERWPKFELITSKKHHLPLVFFWIHWIWLS